MSSKTQAASEDERHRFLTDLRRELLTGQSPANAQDKRGSGFGGSGDFRAATRSGGLQPPNSRERVAYKHKIIFRVVVVRHSDYISDTYPDQETRKRDQMPSVADEIMKRVSAQDSRSWVSTPKDFLDLGSREAVDQALSRLVKAGRLRRIGTGLYDTPRTSRVLKRPAPVDLDAAIAAITRRDAIRILPDGLASANQLGLTTAVPAKVYFVTDGASRTLKIDGRTVRFRHASPSVMRWAGRSSARVAQALRWLGPDAVTEARVVSILRRRLPDDVKRDLYRNIRDLPGWALPLVRSITSDQDIP